MVLPRKVGGIPQLDFPPPIPWARERGTQGVKVLRFMLSALALLQMRNELSGTACQQIGPLLEKISIMSSHEESPVCWYELLLQELVRDVVTLQ